MCKANKRSRENFMENYKNKEFERKRKGSFINQITFF